MRMIYHKRSIDLIRKDYPLLKFHIQHGSSFAGLVVW